MAHTGGGFFWGAGCVQWQRIACENKQMTHRLSSILMQRPILADGAYATALACKLGAGERAEQLNLRAPARVRALAQAYVDAGAMALWSNTFGVVLPQFPDADRVAALREGVAISRAVAGHSRAVFASLGPMTEAAGYVEFAQTARGAGADAVVLETMTRLPAALAACCACAEADLPTALSFTLQRDGDGVLRTLDGVPLLEAAQRVQQAGAFAVGVNCCDGPDMVIEAVQILRKGVSLPILARPNAGIPEPADAASFARAVATLADAGAWLIGGCCGTTPAHLAAAARTLAAR